MAFTMQWGTGFEPGHVDLLGLGHTEGTITISDSILHTGNYALLVGYYPGAGTFWVDTVGSPSDLYVALWAYPGNSDSDIMNIRIWLGDDKTINLRRGGPDLTWDLYIDGVLEAEGTVETDAKEWQHIQIHYQIADAGQIDTKIEGIDDISYSGDTKPGTSDVIDKVGVNQSYGPSRVDDFCFGTDGWPGDIRFEALVPNADTATIEWDGSDGNQVDNYALVDEHGPDTDDYVESVASGEQDKYDLEDFDITNKDPIAVMLWAYAKKDEADAHQLKLIMDDGTEDVGAAQDLLTDWSYAWRLELTAPSGGDWTDALLDALEVGFESVIV